MQKFFAQALLGVYWGAVISESSQEQQYALQYFKGNIGQHFMTHDPKRIGREMKAAIDFYQLRGELAKENLYHFVFDNPAEKFDEEKFNKTLESYLAKLGDFTNKMTEHLNTGYPQIVFYGHFILSRRYRAFGQALLAFRPKGVDENYQQSFLKTMKELGNQFLGESKKQQKLGVDLLNRQQVLLFNGSGLALEKDHVVNAVQHRHPSFSLWADC